MRNEPHRRPRLSTLVCFLCVGVLFFFVGVGWAVCLTAGYQQKRKGEFAQLLANRMATRFNPRTQIRLLPTHPNPLPRRLNSWEQYGALNRDTELFLLWLENKEVVYSALVEEDDSAMQRVIEEMLPRRSQPIGLTAQQMTGAVDVEARSIEEDIDQVDLPHPLVPSEAPVAEPSPPPPLPPQIVIDDEPMNEDAEDLRMDSDGEEPSPESPSSPPPVPAPPRSEVADQSIDPPPPTASAPPSVVQRRRLSSDSTAMPPPPPRPPRSVVAAATSVADAPPYPPMVPVSVATSAPSVHPLPPPPTAAFTRAPAPSATTTASAAPVPASTRPAVTQKRPREAPTVVYDDDDATTTISSAMHVPPPLPPLPIMDEVELMERQKLLQNLEDLRRNFKKSITSGDRRRPTTPPPISSSPFPSHPFGFGFGLVWGVWR